MNINLNPYLSSNRPLGSDLGRLQDVDPSVSGQIETGDIRGPSLVVTERSPEISTYLSEDIEERDPVRDDDLGKMVKAAFDLRPPEIPDFV